MLLLVALVLRAPGVFTDLWLDEVWSLQAVENMGSSLEVFTAFKSDNNHHLNSLWLYLLGPGAAGWRYRLAAVVAGTAGVLFAWLLGRRDGTACAVLSPLLVAVSFPLVLYSSEARGYALVVAAALGAWHFLQGYADRPGWARAWPFWTCALIGLLSHVTILYTLVGSCVWLALHERFRTGTWMGVFRPLLQALGVPILASAAFAWFVLRGSVLGGGPPYSLPLLLADTLAASVGILSGGPVAAAVATVVGLLFLESLWWQARRGDDRWVFYATTVVAAPAFVLLAARPPFLFARYFATQVAFMLVALAVPWSARHRTAGVTRAVAGCLLATYLGTSVLATVRFWSLGRGRYQEALGEMCRDAARLPVAIASDHDFRNGMLVRYFARHGNPGCDVTYLARDALPRAGADWFVAHQVGPTVAPRPALEDVRGNRYRFVRGYPAHALSGMSWYVYRAELGGRAEKP